MLSLLLLKKILSLYLILLSGALLVRSRLLKADSGKVISVINMYLIAPCSILSSFQIEHSPELTSGLLLTFLAGIIMTVINIVVSRLFRQPFRLNAVEELSVGFPNVGNLVIPLVTAVLGPEWVVYTLGFIVVQNIMIWTYADPMLKGDAKINWKKILVNPNIITIALSILLFLLNVKLPAIVTDAASSVGNMIGPVSMLVTGVVIGSMDLKAAFTDLRSWLATGLRLVVLPLLCLLVLKILPLASMHPDGKTILTIILIATSSCSMSSVMQLSSVYGGNTDQACAINVLTTLLCVVTLPVMVYLYQL